MLLATVTSLDNTTVYQYVSYATSSFDEHSTLGIIQTAQAIIIAVSRPLVSKESLLIGLGWSFLVAIVLYCAGYAVVAASPSIAVYAVGTLAAQLGNSALVSLQSTAIFTYSASLGNNALLNSFLSAPYLCTGWVASFIVEGILNTASWRWGYGMFCIMTPVLILPLLIILFVGQHPPERSSSPSRSISPAPVLPPPSPTRSITSVTLPLALPSRSSTVRRRLRAFVSNETHAGQLDAVGLVLLAVALAGLLLPFTVVSQGSTTFSSPLFYVPVSVGAISVVLLVCNERRAACPLFPMRVFRTRRTIMCLSATALNMTSFFLLLTFQYSFIQVMYPSWSPLVQGFFAFSEQFTLMIVHLAVSFPVRRLVAQQTDLQKRGELFEPAGNAMLRAPMVDTACASSASGSWLLVASQVIHGAGGAVAGVFCTQVALAAVPTPADSTMIWALILLVGDIGNATGTALATLLWQDLLPRRLVSRLSTALSSAEITTIFDSAEKAAEYPLGSAASEGIRAAYADVMRILLYVALGLAVLSFALSLAMGPACVAERDETASAAPPAELGPRREQRSVEHVLGRRGSSRWRNGEGGGEEATRYLQWARAPANEPGSESDGGSDWSDEKA
ncbi:hypothetical protein JCM8208_001422 [Rhodotorula glutinis]